MKNANAAVNMNITIMSIITIMTIITITYMNMKRAAPATTASAV